MMVKENINKPVNTSAALARDEIIEVLVHGTAEEKSSVLEYILHIDHPDVSLEKLARDPDKNVRKLMIDALSREKSEKAKKIIRERLDDTDTIIIYTAMEYLGNFKDTASVAIIETIVLSSKNFMVTCSGLEALAKIGVSPGKHIILEKFLTKNTGSVLTFPLLKYLGAFGDNDSFFFFEQLLDISPEMFIKEIIDAVEAILERSPNTTLPASLQERLEEVRVSTENNVNKYTIARLLQKNETGGSSSI